jgi:hypothetical protein
VSNAFAQGQVQNSPTSLYKPYLNGEI